MTKNMRALRESQETICSKPVRWEYLKSREMNTLSQGHKTTQWQRRNSNSDLVLQVRKFSTTTTVSSQKGIFFSLVGETTGMVAAEGWGYIYEFS